MTTPQQIDERVDQAVTWITWFAGRWRAGNWVRRFTLVGVLWLVTAGAVWAAVGWLLHSVPPWVNDAAPWVYGAVAVGLFAAAVAAAVRVEAGVARGPAPPTPVLKFLNPHGPEDADLFRDLQRDQIRDACLNFLGNLDLRLGVLSGESGVGKTSFLRAGLVPALKDRGQFGLYVRLTGLPPLDSFFQAVRQADGLPDGAKKAVCAKKKLGTALAALADELARLPTPGCSAAKPLTVVFDQFEQVFALPDVARREFARGLADWFQAVHGPPARVLVSIREDRVGQLTPLQQEVGYTLAKVNNLRLERFTPDAAGRAFTAITGAAGIEADQGFVDAELIPALAARADGRVSPVDLQVLAWVVAQQQDARFRTFTRTAYQRLGGFEGLMEQYLGDAVGRRETAERRGATVAVLAALCDFDTQQRAGAKTLPELRAEVTHPAAAVDEAVGWLASPEVRLVVPVTRGEDEAFEVIHEKLIPAVRRLAHRLLDDLARADVLLNRRVNEWLGNDRAPRFLLTRREDRLVRANASQLTWGANRAAKEEFLAAGRRNRRRVTTRRALLGALLAVAVGLGVELITREAVALSQAGRVAKDQADAADAGHLTAERLVALEAAAGQIPDRHRQVIRDRLGTVARDAARPAEARTAASVLLALQFGLPDGEDRAADLDRLSDWLVDARNDDHFKTSSRLLDKLLEDGSSRDGLIGRANKVLAAPSDAGREANAVLVLARCEQTQPLRERLGRWPVGDPKLRTLLIDRYGRFGGAPTTLMKRLRDTPLPPPPERRALLLALGSSPTKLPLEDQAGLRKDLLGWYETDSDPGVHGAVWWLLTKWDRGGTVGLLRAVDARTPWEQGRAWFGTSLKAGGHAFTVVELPGGRLVGVGAREVTVAEFRAFNPSYRPDGIKSEDCPAVGVSWYEAARYCQWLSEQETKGTGDYCYPLLGEPGWKTAANTLEGLKLPSPDVLGRTGYRLPTREEWECACRAGATTAYSFGNGPELLGEYAWYAGNADQAPHPVGGKKPNEFGLFDVHGNAREWCHDVPPQANVPADATIGPDRVPFYVDRVLKGGAYLHGPEGLQVCWPGSDLPRFGGSVVGFRVARTLRPGAGR